jgi:hypothetical protein
MILQNDSRATVHALRVLQSPCYDIEGCDWFVVRVDADLAFRLLDRLNLFETVQAKDEALREIIFSDASGRFTAEIDPLGEFLRGSEADLRLLVVRPGEVLWRAHHPDYDVELETEALSVDELREVAGRALVRIG